MNALRGRASIATRRLLISGTRGGVVSSSGRHYLADACLASPTTILANRHQFLRRPQSSSASPATDDGSEDAIHLSDFSYNLKEESIAKYPAYPRGTSKLVRVDADGRVSFYNNFTESFPDLADGAHIVFNESKVVNGRLQVKADNDGQDLEMMILDMGDTGTEVDCIGVDLKVMLRRVGVEVGATFVEASQGMGKFEVVGVSGLWEEDEKSNGNGTECTVRCIAHDQSVRTLGDMLDAVGTVPIPPYLDREADEADKEAYNNVYAAGSGSVAAPTAGLHFTDALLRQIGDENLSFLSLHVGAGTFKPVVAEDARDHKMHAETFQLSVGEVRRIISALETGKRLIVVGTTSSRTLESLFWCGVKRIAGFDGGSDNLCLGQEEWIPLLADPKMSSVTAATSLGALIAGKNDDDYLRGSTSLMIIPRKYEFKVVDNLITNFHAPDSTLMLLVSAFLGSGEKVRAVYAEAQERGYKFLSYGDVCLFSRPAKVGSNN